MTGISKQRKGAAEAKKAAETTLHLTRESYEAFLKVMAFRKGETKKEVLADIIAKEAAKYKGKKPPKK